MGYGWESERVRLVPLDEAKHFENCLRWINDPDVSEWILGGDEPMSRLQEKNWFDSVTSKNKEEFLFAIELLDGTHIGNSDLHRIDHKHKTAHSGSLIGPKEYRGQGYGTEAAQLRAWYAFTVLGLRILRSGYLGGNELSARMQAKSGYEIAGIIPGEYWKRGAYHDHVMTYLTRERWLSLSGGNKSWKA